MPLEGDLLFRDRDEILADMQSQLRLLVPDIYLGPDGNVNLLMKVMSGVIESVFLSNQIVSEDMFVITANEGALERWGEQFGVPRKLGTVSTGTVKFFGEGGTFIPAGTEVAYDPGTGEAVIYFRTTENGTIPNPGLALAPTVTDTGAGNISGAIEYAVSFLTDSGETIIGEISEAITVTSRQLQLTNIPIGGPGTIGRRIYRQKDGDGIWKLVTTINDNTDTDFDDNVADGSLGAVPPAFSTAETIEVEAESELATSRANLGIGFVDVLANAPDGATAVTNTTLFSGATDSEPSFDYRQRLLRAIRAPATGSPSDLKAWAEEIEGVETATVYTNDNLGTPQNGHATVRVSGPNSEIPDAAVVAQVQAELNAKDLANITIHVAGFTALPTDVTVDVVLETGFVMGDVTSSVQLAIAEYINSLDVGETMMTAGILSAVFNLPGILDVTVTSPVGNQVTPATSKRTVGTITVT